VPSGTAGVEHEAVEGPGRAALVGEPGQAVDLARLGHQAGPHDRPVGLQRRVAETDRVEAVGGQQGRQRLRRGRGSDAVAARDVLGVGLVDDVHGHDVHREHLVHALGDLVERGRQLGGRHRREAAQPARGVERPQRTRLGPARHRHLRPVTSTAPG
jgi:hypothetical protein